MADARIREDVESPYLQINEYMGQALFGPKELISRKVVCSNVQTIATETQASDVGAQSAVIRTNFSNLLQQLNFRILSTSPGAEKGILLRLLLCASESLQYQNFMMKYFRFPQLRPTVLSFYVLL